MTYNNTTNGNDPKKDDSFEIGKEMGKKDGEQIKKEQADDAKSTEDKKDDE